MKLVLGKDEGGRHPRRTFLQRAYRPPVSLPPTTDRGLVRRENCQKGIGDGYAPWILGDTSSWSVHSESPRIARGRWYLRFRDSAK